MLLKQKGPLSVVKNRDSRIGEKPIMITLKRNGKCILALACLGILVLTRTVLGATGDWTTYTNMNQVEDVILKGEELWCATTGGVAVLSTDDGAYAKLTNVEGLGGNRLYCLEIDSAGCFWFGAENGTLTKFNPGEGFWKVYHFIDRDGSRLKINDVAADGDRLWIATSKALALFLIYKHGGEIKETYRRLGEQMKGEEEINSVRVVQERIWAATEAGVAFADKNDPNLLDFSRWTAFTNESSPGLGSDLVHCLTDMDGRIVVGTEDGVFGFEPADSTWYSLGFEGHVVNDLRYEDEGLYAAANSGAYLYEDQSWSKIPTDGLLTSRLNSLAISDEGAIWAGTQGSGTSVYRGQAWENYPIDGPPANLFVEMEVDSKGNLWCAQEAYGGSKFDGTTWTSLSSVPEIDGRRVDGVEMDHQSDIWFSSWGGGVTKFDPDDSSWVRYNEKNSPLIGYPGHPDYVVVNDVAVDEMGNRWFPVWDALDLSRVVCSPADEETAWVVYHDQDGIKFPFLEKIFVQDGHLYICYRGMGLTDYDYNWTIENKGDDRVTTYTSGSHHLSNDAVWRCRVDKDGTLWVGTSSGLDKFDPDWDRFRPVLLPDPLGPQVNDIAVDERNNKWIATINGLGVMNSRDEFIAVYTTFNSGICDNIVRGLKIDGRTGDVWVGTEGGLSRFESGIGAPAEELSDVVPFPNPFIIDEGSEILTFDRLPYEATVRIFTVAGELVREIKSGSQWNGRGEGGELVASGIYLFHVQGASGKSAVGKIAVIRK
jgi:ligand-binding sensor domain-containing protein